MKAALVAAAIFVLVTTVQCARPESRKLPTVPGCNTYGKNNFNCDAPMPAGKGNCCMSPYVCGGREKGKCGLPAQQTVTTLPATTTPAGCPSSGCNRVCPGQANTAKPCSCGYTFCFGKCIANDQTNNEWTKIGKAPPPCRGF